MPAQTPHRPSRTQLSPASPGALHDLLDELAINPPGHPEFHLVSRWAAKHVWRVDCAGEPWAYIRYLLGPAEQHPERWRHMRLGELLHEARVGPRILGLTPSAQSLGRRAAVIEAALRPITREELEARAGEAIMLLSRLHGNAALGEALSQDLTEADWRGYSPIERFFAETRERWFEAVVGRWLEVGLAEVDEAREIVSDLMNRLDLLEHSTDRLGIIVPAHNDPNHGNFMVNRQGALRLIDFEELALNNPVADLGIFLTWYADTHRHRELLSEYPLADPEAVLGRMRIWVPLRYLNIAAHWAARMTRAVDEQAWIFAVESVEEWLRGACELLTRGHVPDEMDRRLRALRDALLARGPLGQTPAG